MAFKRGDKVRNGELIGIIHGPEDFKDYDYNRPSELSELVQFEDSRVWIGAKWLEAVNDDEDAK